MRYRSQVVAYWYFFIALLLFGLQMVFGLLAASKYLGPDPLMNVLPFDMVKAIHTNLLVVWVLTGFKGATYYVVCEESESELHSDRLALFGLGLWTLTGVAIIVGYLFRYTAGNKLLEQPLPFKILIVIAMLIFIYNIGMTIWKAGRSTTTEIVLVSGMVAGALLYLPTLIPFENLTLGIFYRWWTVHLWVEGVWEMVQGALLAFLLMRLFSADRDVMEKWLYFIVALTFIAGILGTAHHYYWIGLPSYWLPIGAVFSALEPLAFFGMAIYAYYAMRRNGRHPNLLAIHWTVGSALFAALGAGILGLAHTWPSVNRWTHGSQITATHGHMAFYGAYVMIILAVMAYSLPYLHGHSGETRPSAVGLWAFWLQLSGMFGMTMAFAAAGITQTYLERIMGLGFLETQQKMQVHYLMLVTTGAIFVIGVGMLLYDFYFVAPRRVAVASAPAREA